MGVRVFSAGLVPVQTPGFGFIAGEAPDGLVTLNNVPGIAVIDVLVRADHAWVRRAISADDGTYRVNGLALGTQYDVIGRDLMGTYGDVIVSRVSPYAAPQITTSALAFQVGMPATTQMQLQYGAGPFSWSAVGLPPGVSLSPGGLFSGLPTTAGSYSVTITVVDTHGASGSRAYTAAVT